jgi:membrane fusion protein, copper/silver efflux system
MSEQVKDIEARPRGVHAASVVRWLLVAAMAALAAWSIVTYVRRDRHDSGGGDGHSHGALPGPGEAAATDPAAATRWYCPMHPNIVRDAPGTCPICGMELEPLAPAAGTHPGHGGGVPGLTAITLSADRVQLIGLRTAVVERRPLAAEIRTVGTVTAREGGQSRVDTRFAGWIDSLAVAQTGVPVKKGQVLATLYSTDLVAAQQELLTARTWATGPGAPPNGAQLLGDARERLIILGLSRADVARVEQTGVPLRSFPVRAPAAGYVTAKNVMLGSYVQPGASLFEIADLATVWVQVDVFEHELALVQPGQKVHLSLPAWRDETFTGVVDLVYPSADPRTRTVKVRAELKNPQLRLRPGMFGDVTLETPPVDALVVPREAVVDVGHVRYLFVALDGGRFEPRAITSGLRAGELVEVRSGVAAGERVVTTANFLIDSESRLRAAIEGQGATP